MIINQTDKWAYIGINKAGSTSLHAFLQQPPYNGFNPDITDQHRRELPDGAFDKVLLVVRNPFDRALSIWKHACLNGVALSFIEFLKWQIHEPYNFHNLPQCWFDLTTHRTVVKLEELATGIQSFFELPHIPEIPYLNVIPNGDLNHYNQEAVDLVLQCYWQDFERFNYSTELLS